MLLHFQDLSHSQRPLNTVVLLHGLFGMSDNLMGLAHVLAADFRVIVPDLINHGRSPHRQRMDYPSMAADVRALLDSLSVKSCLVMGHSMGGKVAMQLAHDNPGLVKRLAIADIAPLNYPPRHNTIIDAMFKVADKAIYQRREADTLLQPDIEEPSLRQFFMKNMVKADDGLWHWRFGLQEIAEAYAEICAAPSLSHVINEPVLFIKGAESDYITESAAALIRESFPEAQLKIIAGAGHWLHAEKPQVFNRIVQRFFLA